jgi:nucleoside-diphosphate kinase
MLERTLMIVKPDAVAAGHTGEIVARVEKAGFRLRAIRWVRMRPGQAEEFYAVHRGQPFYASLVEFMCSGPCVPLILEKEDAIKSLRSFIGDTDPAKAASGTIRRDLGTDKGKNAVHASDSIASASIEIPFFFDTAGIV